MLSIRTQNRMALVSYGYIFIERNELCKTHKTDGTNELIALYSYDLYMYVDKVTYIELGTYATQERALEVLYEIETAIDKNNLANYEYFDGYMEKVVEYKYKLQTIYQMPKE